MEEVNDENVDVFLSGWMDNRVLVLIFSKVDIIRLPYLTSAFCFRHRDRLGYVRIHSLQAKHTLRRFGVGSGGDTLLIFHENPEAPVASLTMKELSLNAITEVIEGHQFLLLPRLSS